MSDYGVLLVYVVLFLTFHETQPGAGMTAFMGGLELPPGQQRLLDLFASTQRK